MNSFITQLLEDGLTLTVSMKDGKVVYDLETGMKSECIVTELDNGMLHLSGRYDWEEDYDTNEHTYKDFIWHVYEACHHGREYCSAGWSELLDKYNIPL